VIQDGVRVGPATEPYEGLCRERVEIATKASVEPGETRLGYRVEHLRDRFVVGTRIHERDTEVEHGERSREGIGRGCDRLTAQVDATGGVTAVIDDDAEHPSRHRPCTGVGVGSLHEVHDALGSRLRGVVTAEHEFGLCEPCEHSGRLRSRVVGQ